MDVSTSPVSLSVGKPALGRLIRFCKCGNQISDTRLAANRNARECIECATELEGYRAQTRPQSAYGLHASYVDMNEVVDRDFSIKAQPLSSVFERDEEADAFSIAKNTGQHVISDEGRASRIAALRKRKQS